MLLLPTRHRFSSKVLEINDLTPTVKEFVFEVPDDFFFHAGQFITLRFSVENRIVGRAYSIASKPNQKGRIDVAIKLVENGLVTSKLFTSPMKELDLAGPMGRFFLDSKQTNQELIFIGTGTGVAPLKSMIEDFLEKNYSQSIKLIFGVRYLNEFLYEDLWKSLKRKYSNFDYLKVISRPENSAFNGKKGRVGDYLPPLINNNLDQLFVICGLKEMIETVVGILDKNGVMKQKILYEKYD